MNKPIIYLAGNMTPSPESYNKWTKNIEDSLKYKFRCTASHFKSGNNFIVQQDLGRLKNAHILIVNLGVSDISNHLTGLVVECYEAFKQNKPVYAFVSNDLIRSNQADSPWIQSFITHEFNSQSEMINYLINDDNLIV